MATLSTCNRTFLQRFKLLGSIHKMTKHGNEKKERKKEKRKKENLIGYWESHLVRILVFAR